MKKIFTLLVLSFVAVATWGQDIEVDGLFYNIKLNSISNKTVEVTYKGIAYKKEYSKREHYYTGSIVIPSEIEYDGVSYTVTDIGTYAFLNCKDVTSVTIPNTVTSIGAYAFSGCSGLTSITIPSSVTSISEDIHTFENCTALSSIDVESGNTTYDSRDNCNAIIKTSSNTLIVGCKNTTIPNTVTSIEAYAFSGCSGLTSITIPSYVTNIRSSAFTNCTALSSIAVESGNTTYDSRDNCNAIIETSSNTLVVGCKNSTIPNTVTSIGSGAFRGCEGLITIGIPNSVTSIGECAFQGCSSLASITVESGNTTYDSRDNCNAIIKTSTNTLVVGCKNSTIPNTITSIGNNAFYDNTGLTTIGIPNSVTSIGAYAFSGCSNLTTVTISNSVKEIQHEAFSDCNSLKNITIPNSMESIGNDAFDNCTSLTILTIPSSINSISLGAFTNCTALSSIAVESGNTTYDSRDNCNAIIETSSNTLVVGCKNSTIPNTVTSIGSGAFEGCEGLQSVDLPNSLIKIGYDAFRYCTGLTSVTIPSSVTLLDGYAFGFCTNLKSVIIPNSVTSIGRWTFIHCNGLESVIIPTSVKTFDMYSFQGCLNLTKVYDYATSPQKTTYSNPFSTAFKSTLYVPQGCINTYKAASYWNEFKEIKEMDPSAVENIKAMPSAAMPAQYYQINGTQSNGLQKGLNIIKTQNGVKKVMVK